MSCAPLEKGPPNRIRRLQRLESLLKAGSQTSLLQQSFVLAS